MEEGCLSVPGYRGTISRSLWVRFGALDHGSEVVELKAEGMLSQILEHEVDHLNGILYLDHLKSHDDLVKIEPQEMDMASLDASPDGVDDADQDAGGVQTGGIETESTESPATIRVR